MIDVPFIQITPWTSDRNLSGFYNAVVESLPDKGWVLFTDRDCYWPDPFYGHHIEQIIKENGDEFGLMTCMTNRVGTGYQCVKNSWTIEKCQAHKAKAISLWEKNGAEVINISDRSPISGMMMLMQKEFLTENRMLKDGLLLGGDNDAHYIANEYLMNVGLCTGLYIFHAYRCGQQHDRSHLI